MMVVVTPRVGQSVRAARQPATMQGLPRTQARSTQVVHLGSSTSEKQDPGTPIQASEWVCIKRNIKVSENVEVNYRHAQRNY